MKYELEEIPTYSFDEWCEMHGLTMVVKERSKKFREMLRISRYYASPKEHVEIMDDGILRSTFGSGDTPEQAVEDYAREILGERLVKNAYGEDRYEFDAPDEWTEI